MLLKHLNALILMPFVLLGDQKQTNNYRYYIFFFRLW